jgi:hypothetical protein
MRVRQAKCGTPSNHGCCRQVPPDNPSSDAFELSDEDSSPLEEHGEAMFGELHAEMCAQQDRRVQLVPGFLQIAAAS